MNKKEVLALAKHVYEKAWHKKNREFDTKINILREKLSEYQEKAKQRMIEHFDLLYEQHHTLYIDGGEHIIEIGKKDTLSKPAIAILGPRHTSQYTNDEDIFIVNLTNETVIRYTSTTYNGSNNEYLEEINDLKDEQKAALKAIDDIYNAIKEEMLFAAIGDADEIVRTLINKLKEMGNE